MDSNIDNLEKALGVKLHLAPTHGNDPVRNVMACRTDPAREDRWLAQYALHPDGAFAGLNLAGYSFTNELWNILVTQLDLSRLEMLNLRGNALTQFPLAGKTMRNLRYLDLSENEIIEFTLPEGMQALEHLFLYGNKYLISPPAEIMRQGRFALRNYFNELAEQGSEIVYEAKMLILGDAGAGKTTLARKIEDPDALPPDAVKDSTPGIMVQSLQLTDASPVFTMHLWDFGGQEVYHATHQFFLTKKSLYVLLCDGRKEEQFDYWLQMQEIYGQDSRLLMVVNQKGAMQPNLPMSDLRRDYPNIQEGKPIVINLATDREAVVALRKHIERSIRNLPQFERGERVPKKWAAIRRHLEGIEKDHILITEFREICRKEGIPQREKQDFLLDFLHDLGVFLFFKEVAGLNKLVILRPEWATSAVYNVLDHTRKKGDNGHFTRADLDKVWKCAAYEDYFEELLLLMERFELCFRAPEEEGLFIMPSLLPDESPEGYTWDEPTALQVQYQYTFMPKGIISRLIVRQHGLLESSPVMWKRGAVMSDNGARVEVTESYRDKRINIRSNGHGRNAKELMMTIAREIDLLNRSFHFNERMKVEQKIPCNCPVCQELTTPHYFLRSNLDKADRVKQKVQCQESFEMIDVRALLDGVFASEGSNISRSTIEGLIELDDLKEALEAMKSEYPDAVLHLSELNSNEKAYREGRIDLAELGKVKARLRLAVMDVLS
jgi:internalin A